MRVVWSELPDWRLFLDISAMTKRDQGKRIDLNDIWPNLRHSAEW